MRINGADRLTALRIAALAVVFACTPVKPHAQVSVEHARKIARTTVQASSGRAREIFLSVHRSEELEDLFCTLVSSCSNDAARDPYFFEVSDWGYEFHGNRINYHLPGHEPFLRYVAVSTTSGEVFRISGFGFKDSADEFNRLTAAYRVNIGSELIAWQLLELYLDVDPQRMRLKQLGDILEAKHSAEREFSYVYDELKEAEGHFNNWWKKIGTALARQSFKSTITKTDSGYLVTFLVMSGINKKHVNSGPVLLKALIEISTAGQVDDPKFVPVALQ